MVFFQYRTDWRETPRELRPHEYDRIGIGKRHRSVALEKIPDACVYKEALRKYIQNIPTMVDRGVGMLILGELRSGKTSAASILAMAVTALGGRAFFIRADDLQKAAMEKLVFDEYRTVYERMKEVDLLVVDDVGAGAGNPYAKEVLENIVRHRYDHMRPLVVTSNKTLDELKAFCGEGVVRVMESMMRVVPVEGTNWYDGEVKDVSTDGKV